MIWYWYDKIFIIWYQYDKFGSSVTGHTQVTKDGHIDLVRQGPYVGQEQRGHISTLLYWL